MYFYPSKALLLHESDALVGAVAQFEERITHPVRMGVLKCVMSCPTLITPSCPTPTGHLPYYLPAVCTENRHYSAFQLYIQIGCGVVNVGQMAAGGHAPPLNGENGAAPVA